MSASCQNSSSSRAVASSGSTQRAVDAAVALITVPLLVMFGVLLESNMRNGDWTTDPRARWHVLVLGLSLLFMSLFVCMYVIHRLGICLWQTSHYDHFSVQHHNRTRDNGDCRMHILVSGEMPPSYDSIVNLDQPPPYCSIFIVNGLESTLKQATG